MPEPVGTLGSGRPGPSSISTDSNAVIPTNARTLWAGGREQGGPPEGKAKTRMRGIPVQVCTGGFSWKLRLQCACVDAGSRGAASRALPSMPGESQETGHQPINPTPS